MLKNYYSQNNEIVDIPLNDNLSLSSNANVYFKKYAKAKNAKIYASDQLDHYKRELVYLESINHNIEQSEDTETLEEVRNELIKEGYVTYKRPKKLNKELGNSMPYHYRSSEGFDIYVGKNNMQNDMLTLKMAAKNDMWLHTKLTHGSHVIISGKVITQKALFEAANIAAYHSKAKMSSNVEVDYTEVRNVKKPSGSKPGMVVYYHHKTLVVTPQKELVERLRIKG
jgi:predicted ribosome quality control (RQC) complex YloA/Tae2 family protein